MRHPTLTRMAAWRPGTPLGWVAAAYIAIAGVATYQRGVASRAHTTFPIFRQSFVHLLHGVDLYARYPTEQGAAPFDLFKYSPTAALLFAPFALVPFTVALFAWDLLNALMLLYAVLRVIPDRRRATIAAALLLPQVLTAVQSSSSNALVAALMLLSFAMLQEGRYGRGAVALVAGTVIKIFPLAGVTLIALDHRSGAWRRFTLALVASMVVAAVLPLLIVSPHTLAFEYRSWAHILASDSRDLRFGDSLMAVLRRATGGTWPNWTGQLAGTVVLLVPLAMRRGITDWALYRRRYLASLLIYVVLFNHQAEMQSFVIAATGTVIWYVDGRPTWARTLLAIWVLAGGKTLPCTAVWLALQWELWQAHQTPAPNDASWIPRSAIRSRTTGATSDRSSSSRLST